ncbi:MAG: dihydroorotate dehydrogenase electron transfer subunit [bacterium]
MIVTIVSNKALGKNYFKMVMLLPDRLKEINPGRFFMVKAGQGSDPLLRRPLSVHDFWEDKGLKLAFLYRVVGRGTGILSRLSGGDELDIVGPLGNGFKVSENTHFAVLVAGGIGIAPFKAFARQLKSLDIPTVLFFGGRDRGDAALTGEFSDRGMEIITATEDGSVGCRGLVTEALADYLSGASPGTSVYACGPQAMIEAVTVMSRKYKTACQVSLEQVMACGLGVCRGCVIPGKTDTGYMTVCHDGPVFNVDELS